MKSLGTARRPAFDTRYLPVEMAAAGYEANGADTDYAATHWTDRPLSVYRETAERVFDAEARDYERAEKEWTDSPAGARWSAEVIYTPAEGETDSGYWFSRATFEPAPEDVYLSGYVLPGLPADDILEVTIRTAPGHPDFRHPDDDDDDDTENES